MLAKLVKMGLSLLMVGLATASGISGDKVSAVCFSISAALFLLSALLEKSEKKE